MNTNELVSVIMPSYNRAYIVGRAIKSVLSQTYTNFELIIIDDGSTDDTAEVVKSFNDSRIIYVKHARNLGIASARNTGIDVSRGEYIAFLDSDDEWLPDKLREQLIAFEEAPSDVGAVYTQMQNTGKGKTTYLHRKTPPEGNIHKHVLSGLPIYLVTLMVKRKYLEQTGIFDKDFVFADDWDFCIRLSKICNFRFVKTPLAIRYIESDSISVNSPILPRELEKILNKHFDEIRKDRRVLVVHYAWLGRVWCLMNNLVEGRRYYARAWRANPFNLRPLLGFVATILGRTFYNAVYRTYAQLRGLPDS
jgi:glycosyltransferase involved in cell wall biosynthesis